MISLLSLPDFLGYIFRKSKKSQDHAQFGDKKNEVSSLVSNSYKCLTEIDSAELFHFVDANKTSLSKALQINIE